MVVQLTQEQQDVLYKIVSGVQKEGVLETTLGGYAGTGKTTLIRYLAQIFPDYGVCAFTGKAANVLRKKKVSATTIHSRIYVPIIEYGTLVGFERAERGQLGCNGFIVDEASMVSKCIYEDLSSYDLPSIYVGDHGQLEPIGTDFNLMTKPMYRLEKIHRNAGEIAKFSQHLRMRKNAIGFRGKEGKVRFLNKYNVTDDHLIQTDQIICAYNATRVNLNKRIRAILGYSGDPRSGERVICLRNNNMLQLFNGMQGIVQKVYLDNGGRTLMDFEFDGTIYSGVWYDKNCFNVERPEFDGLDGPNPFDFAYAITCHKAQGDEFNRGLVYEQRCKNWNHWRWAYTAASRFKTHLDWIPA